MRVLFVNPGLYRHGGAERYLLGALDGLAQRGVETRVVVFGEGDLATLLRQRGPEVRVVSIDHLFRPAARYRGALGVLSSAAGAAPAVPRLVRAVRAEVARFGADIVHTNGSRAHVIAPFLSRDGASTVATLHDVPVTRAEERIMSAALRRLDAVVANSPLVAQRFATASVPCQVIDNPVERPVARDRTEARHRLGVPDDAFVVASLAHFHWYKGQLDLVRAVGQLDKDCHVILAGGLLYGPASHAYMDEVRAAAADPAAAPRIHFVGLQDDVSWIYAAADIVAHCSVHPEPFGMAIVEAMSCGTPVVASSAGTPGEMLEDGHTALLYAPGDVSGLARCLTALREDPSLRAKIGANGQAWVGDRFSPTRHAQALLDVYERVRAARRAHGRPWVAGRSS